MNYLADATLGWDEPPEAGYGYATLRRPCPPPDEPEPDWDEPVEYEAMTIVEVIYGR